MTTESNSHILTRSHCQTCNSASCFVTDFCTARLAQSCSRSSQAATAQLRDTGTICISHLQHQEPERAAVLLSAVFSSFCSQDFSYLPQICKYPLLVAAVPCACKRKESSTHLYWRSELSAFLPTPSGSLWLGSITFAQRNAASRLERA